MNSIQEDDEYDDSAPCPWLEGDGEEEEGEPESEDEDWL